MNNLPRLTTLGRSLDVLGVLTCCIGQAGASIYSIFATRDAVASWSRDEEIPKETFVEFGVALLIALFCFQLARRRAASLGKSYSKALQHSIARCSVGASTTTSMMPDPDERAVLGLGDVSATQQWFSQGLLYLTMALVIFPLALGALFYLEPNLAQVSLPVLCLTLTLSICVAWWLGPRIEAEMQSDPMQSDPMQGVRTPAGLSVPRGWRSLKRFYANAAKGSLIEIILYAGVLTACFLVLWRAGQTGAVLDVVLASLAILLFMVFPLRNLVAAWHMFCNWRRTRDKALGLLGRVPERLLDFSDRKSFVSKRLEHFDHSIKTGNALKRAAAISGLSALSAFLQSTFSQGGSPEGFAPDKAPVTVGISGRIHGLSVAQTFPKGKISRLEGAAASSVAQAVAGLSRPRSVVVCFDGAISQPLTAYIGDFRGLDQPDCQQYHSVHPAYLLQAAGVSSASVQQALVRYSLDTLITAEQLRGSPICTSRDRLSGDDMLRFDLMCAELAQVSVLVVDWLNSQLLQVNDDLLMQFSDRCSATVLVVS